MIFRQLWAVIRPYIWCSARDLKEVITKHPDLPVETRETAWKNWRERWRDL